MTGADGYYHFDGLAPGTYRVVEVQPPSYLDGKETLGTVDSGVAIPPAGRGTIGADQFEIELGAGDKSSNYNFGERGLRPDLISLRYALASTPRGADLIASIDAAPTVTLSSPASPAGQSPTFVPGEAPVAVAPNAVIADADSEMLAWLSATITNLRDGASEKLGVDTGDSSIISNYADGLLTLSGPAERAVYERVLRTLTYSDNADSPTPDGRNIRIVVNDGIVSSAPATVDVSVTALDAAVVDAVLASGL